MAARTLERGRTHCCTLAGQSLEQPSTRGQNVHTLQRGCDLHAAQQSAAVNTGPGARWREFTSYTRTSPPTLACRVASTHAHQPQCSSPAASRTWMSQQPCRNNAPAHAARICASTST